MATKYTNKALQAEYEDDPRVRMARTLLQSGASSQYKGGNPYGYGLQRIGDLLGGTIAQGRATKEFSEKEKALQDLESRAMGVQDREERAKIYAESPYMMEEARRLEDEARAREEKLSDLSLGQKYDLQKIAASSAEASKQQQAQLLAQQTMADLLTQREAQQKAEALAPTLETAIEAQKKPGDWLSRVTGGWLGEESGVEEAKSALISAGYDPTKVDKMSGDIARSLVKSMAESAPVQQQSIQQRLSTIPSVAGAVEQRQFAKGLEALNPAKQTVEKAKEMTSDKMKKQDPRVQQALAAGYSMEEINKFLGA